MNSPQSHMGCRHLVTSGEARTVVAASSGHRGGSWSQLLQRWLNANLAYTFFTSYKRSVLLIRDPGRDLDCATNVRQGIVKYPLTMVWDSRISVFVATHRKYTS